MLPVILNSVYHPDFQGSFSLKFVLPALVPELTYDDLVIVDGMVASVEIARLLFVAGQPSPEQHEKTRYDLLEYCERDTWGDGEVIGAVVGVGGDDVSAVPNRAKWGVGSGLDDHR